MKKTGKDLVTGDYIYVLDKKYTSIRKIQITGIEIHGYHFEDGKLTDKIKDYGLRFKVFNDNKRCVIGSENFEEERGIEYNAFIYKADAIKRVEKIIDLQIDKLIKYKKSFKSQIK